MARTKIEWADRVWNPIIGCSPAGAGCKNCYAARIATRLAANPKTTAYYGLANGCKWSGKFVFMQNRLQLPDCWKKPCLVFVNSMSDLFHPEIPDEWIFDVLSKIRGAVGWAYDHTYLILTKRPERIIKPFNQGWKFADMFMGVNNLWLGVSVWDQESADRLIPLLLQVPAAVRFVSYEPALGKVLFDNGTNSWLSCDGRNRDVNEGECCESYAISGKCFRGIDWVICGPETGPRARTFIGDWARLVRDQCAEAGVPFFFKGWPNGYAPGGDKRNKYMLDGREWKQFPKVTK